MLFRASLLVAPLLASSVFGQTYTDCDPTKKSCPANPGLGKSSYSHDFTTGADDDNWKVTAGNIKYTKDGAEFTVAKPGDAPTIQSKWYMFFGSVSFVMKSAHGTGIISSAIFQSDDLDEIDWEFLGGVPDIVQTNFFSKGNTKTFNREVDANIPSGNSQTSSHNYTICWTKESTQFIIDGKVMRTIEYAQVNDVYGYPQTPMNIRIGIWAGGDPNNAKGTIEWAGGKTDYKAGPYTMTLEKVEVINYAPAGSYEYGDKSGTWESIKVSDKKVEDKDSKDDKDKSSSSASASASASKSGSVSPSASATKSSTQSGDEPKATGDSSNSADKSKNGDAAAHAGSPAGSAAQATGSPAASDKPEQSNDGGMESVQWKVMALLGSLAAIVIA